MIKKIIFVSYGGGHVNMLVPVIKKLLVKENLELVVMGLTTAGAVLEKNGISHIGFKDLLKPSDQQALEWGRKLAAPANSKTIVPYEESIAYMGLSYMDLEFRYGAEKAEHIYQTKGGRQAFFPLSVMERFLREEQPDLVVATNSPRAEKAAIIAAGNLGIPSVCVVDLFASQEIEWIGQSGFSSKVCVLSDFVRDRLVRSGRHENEIIVTGNPAFDVMAEQSDSNFRRTFRECKNWKDSETIVLWASNVEPTTHPYSDAEGDPELPQKVEKQLISFVNKNPKFKVIFRPHPNDVRIPDVSHERIEISTIKDDIGELLMAVDCVVVLSSTVGLQAALIGKPLINVKLSIFSHNAPYDEMGISIGVEKLEDLPAAILKALAVGQQGKGLPNFGVSAEKIVNEIEDLLRDDKCLK